jgi:cell division protein FtsQ
MPERRLALTAANPQLVKARIERLDWVGRASVQRMWPSTIRINVERRTAVAVWRRPGAETVIDAAGAPVSGVAAADVPELPRVIGKNALADAQPVLAALEELPSLRRQVQALVSVGDRRLDLHLKSGLVVALPAENAASALAALMTLDARYDVLDRPLARIDLRDPDRAALLPKDVLAGGPGAPISAADGRGG